MVMKMGREKEKEGRIGLKSFDMNPVKAGEEERLVYMIRGRFV